MLISSKTLLKLGAVVTGGALLSLVYLISKTPVSQAWLMGYFNVSTFTLTLWLLQKLLLAKLAVFTASQQWILKAFIYTILACFAFLVGLLFQYFILTPFSAVEPMITDKLWNGLFLLLAEPMRPDISAVTRTDEFRTVIIPFFALMFLFGLGGLLGSYIEIKWQGDKHTRIVQKAQLTALQAQMEPHFLFNTLNTIAAAIRSDPAQAENLVLKLSDLFRYIFENSGKETTELAQEIAFAREYAELLKARYGDLLQLHWQQDLHSLKQKVPVFLIQPILENSIRHGWSAERKYLAITVDIQEDDQNIVIEIKDDGSGMRSGLVNQASQGRNALGNIVERLQLLYKNRGKMEIISGVSAGTKVCFTIPRDLP
jgi:hypothetical protein